MESHAVNIPVTRTKLLVPRRRADILSRGRLLNILDEQLDQRLVIIAAPAGYGKTSLLVDLANHTGMPVCWFAIDPLDREFKRFCGYFIAAIQETFPAFGLQSSLSVQQMSQAEPDIDQFVTVLANDLYESIHEHFLIVLDDYHFVDDQPEINHFLGAFIQATDENCHLAISSRTLLSLPDLPLMVARSQVGGLGYDELAFNSEEIQALLAQNYHVSINNLLASDLARESEGWITGLLLSSQSRWQGIPDRLRTARVSAVGLYDYLAQQVLDQQPAAMRDFLLRTSLIEEFDAGLCQDVLGPPAYPTGETWSGLIEQTFRNNLFVLPVGDKGQWLRYHHLFRDFLQNRLSQEDPGTEKYIVGRLAQVYTERSEWDKAFALFNRLGNTSGLVELIERAGASLIKTGRLKTLANWIDNLPPNYLSNSPKLLSLRGSAAVMAGEVERGLGFLNFAEAEFRKLNDRPELARTLPRRAHALYFLGKYQAALADAEESIQICADDHELLPIKAMALRSQGLSKYRLGQWEPAIECLKQSAGIYDALTSQEELALVNIDLGMVYQVSGAYRLSRLAYENARAVLSRIGDLPRQATVLNNLGVLEYVLGNYDVAVANFEQALAIAQQSGFAHIESITLASIGDLYRDLDAPEAAEEAYARAQDVALRIDDRFILFYLTLNRASVAFQQRDRKRAAVLLDQALKLSEESKSSYEHGIARLEGGRLALLSGDAAQAIPYFLRAAEAFESGIHHIEEARCNLYLAAAFYDIHQDQDVQSHLARTFEISKNFESRQILVTSARDVKSFLASMQSQPVFETQIRELLVQISQFEINLPTLRRKLRKKTSAVPFAPAHLLIRALGRPQVLQDGFPIQDFGLSSQAARDLFYLLLAFHEGMNKEDIGAILWPDSSIDQLKLQFKNAIYRLRRSLDQDVILLVGNRYQFNTQLDYEYDVDSFETWIDQAKAIQDGDKQIVALQNAVQMYKGSYLSGVAGAWVYPIRSRLNQAFITAGCQLAELFLQNHAYRKALETSEILLHHDACLEEAHRVAMRAYALIGQKADVARQYERCKNNLRSEVNLSPSIQTQELYQKLIK